MKDTPAATARNGAVVADVDAWLAERVRSLVAEYYRIDPERQDPALAPAP